MDAPVFGFIGVVVGGLITSIVAIGLEYIRGRHESSLDSARRADDRLIERERFERLTLVEAQDAVNDLSGALVEYLANLVVLPAQPITLDWLGRYRASLNLLNKLVSRVVDAKLRSSASELVAKAGVVVDQKHKSNANPAYEEFGILSGRFLARSGELIRSSFRPETERAPSRGWLSPFWRKIGGRN